MQRNEHLSSLRSLPRGQDDLLDPGAASAPAQSASMGGSPVGMENEAATLRDRYAALTARYADLLAYHSGSRPANAPAESRSPRPDLLPASLHFEVEQPAADTLATTDLVVAGWCFDEEGDVHAIEVLVDEERHDAQIGMARPDVGLKHPASARARTSGFVAQIPLSAGAHFVTLRAHVGERWIVLREAVVRVGARSADLPLVLALDSPSLAGLRAGRVRFSGWCWHRLAPIVALDLDVGGKVVRCEYGLARDDVADSFPDVSTARRSGFVADIDLSKGTGPVTLTAFLDDGRSVRAELCAEAVVRSGLSAGAAGRVIGSHVAHLLQVRHLALRWMRTRGRLPRLRELPGLARKTLAILRPIPAGTAPAVQPGWSPPAIREPYDVWLELNAWSDRRRNDLLERLADCEAALPRISVVMPVYDPDSALLAEAIDSVRRQVYANWELCIADDRSTDLTHEAWLRSLAQGDDRVHVAFRGENGNISAATNSAAGLATGEFLLFLDQDDLLTPDALGEIALRLAHDAEVDLLYADDDKIDRAGHRRYDPQFKPGWSPELLLSYMYLGHPLVVRRALFASLGGFRVGYEGSQDHDFALRAGEAARQVAHVPLILYHWRAVEGSTALDANAKPHAFAAAARAIGDAFERRGIKAGVRRPEWAVRSAVGVFTHDFSDDGPRVSIVIPTRNGLDVLHRCIDSLSRTSYRNFEVVVVDNDSDDEATLRYLDGLSHRVLRIPRPQGRFSFADLNNRAVRAVTGELVLFLNNDTEVREPRWLSRMVGYAALPGVGAVGARLLFGNGRVQHAGVVHGIDRGLPGHAFRDAPGDDHGYLFYAASTRNYSAVSAACMLTPRELFLSLGGFDATDFAVAYNDVDYCYRLTAAGHRCVYAAGAELLHHEGRSRGFGDDPREVAAMQRRYPRYVDPFHSPHLSPDDPRFSLKPRRWPVRTTARPLRVLVCGYSLNLEGAPLQQLEQVLGLKQAGVVEPVVYAPIDGPLRADYERAGIEVCVSAHPLQNAVTLAEYELAVTRFGAFVASMNVDLVWANTMETFFAVAAAERRRLPAVWSIHESEPWQTYFAHFPAAIGARALDCFAVPYRVVFVAEATRERYRPLESRHHFVTVHNGLDRRRIAAATRGRTRQECRDGLGVGRDDVVLLLLGTVCARKGQHDLVHALSGADGQAIASVRCFIVGDRPSTYSTELHALVAQLPAPLRDRIRIVTETADTALYYQAADLFVCTSRIESYPRVILEAMAHGLPIVTTPVFGIREQVRNNVNAIFYEPGDVAALRLSLVRLIKDQGARAILAANARPVLDTLTGFDDMVAAYAEILREAAATQRGHGVSALAVVAPLMATQAGADRGR